MRFILNILFMVITTNVMGQLLYNNGADINILSNCDIIVKGAGVQNAVGTINNGGNFTIEGTLINEGTVTAAGTNGVFNIEGDFINNSLFIADQSDVNLYGFNQLISGTSITSFYNLNLLGAGIKTQTTDAVVTNLLNLNNLELATNLFYMTIANPNFNAISRTTGFVSSLGDGRLVRVTNSSNPYLFPVGSSLGTIRYRPVLLIPNATNTEYHIRMVNNNPTLDGFNIVTKEPSILQVNSQFYHIIENTNSVSADITLHYNASEDGDWDINSHWQNLPQWENMNNEYLGFNSGFTTITTPNWSNFSSFAFALAKKAEIESIFIPNAFTPQGDNLNDNFKITGLSVQQISCKIFNRWGEVVYEIKDIDDYWDGQYNNKPSPQGVYTYVINYKLHSNNEWFTKYGTLSLIR